MAAGTAMSTLTRIVMVLALLVSLSGYGMGNAEKKSLKFTYYVHDDSVPPGVTFVQDISVSGNFSAGLSQFGDQSTFNSLVRTGVSANSTLIGYHSGTSNVLNQPNVFIIVLTAELFSSNYNGLYTMQGRFNATQPSWEFVITGGTGSFLGAKGYSTVSVAVPDFVNGAVFRYDVNMLF